MGESRGLPPSAGIRTAVGLVVGSHDSGLLAWEPVHPHVQLINFMSIKFNEYQSLSLQLPPKKKQVFLFLGMCMGGFENILWTFLDDFWEGFWYTFGRFWVDLERFFNSLREGS